MSDEDQFEARIRRTLSQRAESVSSQPDLSSLDRPTARSASPDRQPLMILAIAAAAVLVVVAAGMVVRAGLDRDQQLTAGQARSGTTDGTDTDGTEPDPVTSLPTTTVVCPDGADGGPGGPECPTTTMPNSVPPEATEVPTTATTIPPDAPSTTEPSTPDTTTTIPPSSDTTVPVDEPVDTAACPAGFDATAPSDPMAEVYWGQNQVVLAPVDSGASTTFVGGWAEAVDFEDCYARVTDEEGQPLRLAVGGSVTHLDGIECSEMDSVLILHSGTSSDGITWNFTHTQASLQGTTAVMEPAGETVMAYPEDAEQIERAGTISCP